MSIKIELRYSILTSLLALLWLMLEYMVNLQDTYIAWHPLVSILLSIIIPAVTYRLALKEKIEEKFNKLSLKQAFISGLLMTIFTSIFTIPVQLGFLKFVNPDFLESMITYTVKSAGASPEQAAMYFNRVSYIMESAIITFIIGIIISVILAFRMRTVK
jgi:hypothetical protein